MQGLNTFVVTLAIIIGGVLCGYLLRRLRILDECHGPKISLLLVAVAIPVITCLSVWPIDIETRFTMLPVIQILSFTVILLICVKLSQFHSLGKADQGTFVLACALSNQGFTMGGLVCYLFFGAIGLGLSRIYVAFWPPMVVFILFPLAQSYSVQTGKKSIRAVIFKGICHVRSLSMVGLLMGIAFSRLRVPYPVWIETYYVLKILLIVGTFVSFGLVGLGLHLDHIGKYARLYLSQGFVKFIISAGILQARNWQSGKGRSICPIRFHKFISLVKPSWATAGESAIMPTRPADVSWANVTEELTERDCACLSILLTASLKFVRRKIAVWFSVSTRCTPSCRRPLLSRKN